VLAAAGLQCLLGAAGFVLLSQSSTWDAGSHGFWSAQLVVRVIVGGMLVVAGFHDRRSLLFGTAMILTATAFAQAGLVYLAGRSGMTALHYLSMLPMTALFPFYFWRFARVFPEAFLRPSLDRAIHWAERASLAVGLLLVAANLVLLVYPHHSVLRALDAADQTSLFHSVLYSLAFPILLALWLRMKTAREQERRRVQVFILGLLVSILPALILIVPTGLSADFRAFVLREDIYVFYIAFAQAFVLAMPIITGYAVLVERLLPIRIMLRQSLRYGLGNGFIACAIALPLLLFAYYLYRSRTQSLGALLEGYNGLFLAVALGIALITVDQRQRAQRYLDRLFYRAGYVPGEVLAELARCVQGCASLQDAVRAVRLVLERTLHPQSCYLLFVRNHESLRDPLGELADLPLQSALCTRLLALEHALDVRGVEFGDVGTDDANGRWLSQANASVLVPIRVQSAVSGILVLGSKLSELPYTRADFDFLELALSTVTGTCLPLLDAWNREAREKQASQCAGCGLVVAEPGICPACAGIRFAPALLPKTLHEHYEVARFIGSGLGAVYLAQDLQLQRPVVLKTVTSAATDDLKYLRDEARMMATLNHKNIATIYRFESYGGMPILVCEYLPNGTLADILRNGPLERDDVIDIFEQITQALVYLHLKGVAHGDIKPSNIGFDADDTPKLLDFGLADRLTATTSAGSAAGAGGGTYAYMSPENFRGEKFDQRADLWALAVTLFEAVYGFNPFAGDDLPSVLERVNHAGETLFAAVESPPAFLQLALNDDITKRPQTAEQFLALLRAGFDTRLDA
jgi:hypothetical protein